jgi:phage tail sheath gpL-like
VPAKTVLVISGNEDDRFIWNAVLQHYGYTAVLADSLAAVPARPLRPAALEAEVRRLIGPAAPPAN